MVGFRSSAGAAPNVGYGGELKFCCGLLLFGPVLAPLDGLSLSVGSVLAGSVTSFTLLVGVAMFRLVLMGSYASKSACAVLS